MDDRVSDETFKDDKHAGCGNSRAEQRLPKICVHLLTGVYLVGYCFRGAEAQLLSVPRHKSTDGRYTPCGCLVTQWPRSDTSSKS